MKDRGKPAAEAILDRSKRRFLSSNVKSVFLESIFVSSAENNLSSAEIAKPWRVFEAEE